MNPHYGAHLADAGSDIRPNIEATLDRHALSAWHDLCALARVPGERPPADREAWAAWARGERTAGPRYEGIVLAELRQRWIERRRPVYRPPPMIGAVGAWREFWKYGRSVWGRGAIKRGRTHIEPVVWIVACYHGYRAEWAEWRIPGLTRGTCEGRTVDAVRLAVDAWLRGERVSA